MYVDNIMLKKLEHCQVQTYVSHKVLSESGDVEVNPGPSDQCSTKTNLAPNSQLQIQFHY